MGAAEKIEYHITPGAWFRQELLVPVFGITPDAAKKYRAEGKWLEGKPRSCD